MLPNRWSDKFVIWMLYTPYLIKPRRVGRGIPKRTSLLLQQCLLNEEEWLISSIDLARSYLWYPLVPLTLPQVKVSRKYQDIHSSLIIRWHPPLTHFINIARVHPDMIRLCPTGNQTIMLDVQFPTLLSAAGNFLERNKNSLPILFLFLFLFCRLRSDVPITTTRWVRPLDSTQAEGLENWW